MARPPGGRRAQPNSSSKSNINSISNNDATNEMIDNNGNHNANHGPKSVNNGSNTNKNRRRKNTNRGRGRNGSNNNKSNNSLKNNKPPPPLQLPHAKITIRKIQNIEKFGSREKMADFILCLCGVSPSTSSNKIVGGDIGSNSNVHLIIDEHSLTKCCKDIIPRESNSTETGTSNFKEIKSNEATYEGSGGTDQESLAAKEICSSQHPPITTSFHKNSPYERSDAVTARVLYVIPPRKSRRRGVITGVIYLVLYPPDPTKAYIDATEKNLPNKIGTKGSSETTKDIKLETITSTSSPTQAPQPTLLVGQERSKAVAAARLTLQNAQQYLTSQALLHADELGDCQVELSPSQKTWKDLSTMNKTTQNGSKRSERGDRYENTILNTDDFHKFMENQKKEEEERASRPKPLPGGGEIDISTSSNINNNPLLTSGISSSTLDNNAKDDLYSKSSDANENMMSALALYLRNKKKEQKAKQVAKQSAKQRNSSNIANASGAATLSTSSKKKKKTASLGSIKLMEKTNNSRKLRLGNHVTSIDKKDESSKATSKSIARKKEKKKRKEKRTTKASKNVDDNVVTPILMKNPTNITTAPTNLSSSSEIKSVKNNGGKSITKGHK